jgi:Predicted periplasmic lipoprotein (DUF2279)
VRSFCFYFFSAFESVVMLAFLAQSIAKKSLFGFFLVNTFCATALFAQTTADSSVAKRSFFAPSDSLNTKRLTYLIGGGGLAYAGTVVVLNEVWYAQYAKSRFHYFDDQGEWLQMDKAGHVITAYQEARWSFGAFRWAGMPRRKAAWYAAGVGLLFQTTLETLDGFSDAWGWSWTDMAANTLGSVGFAAQETIWGEQRIAIKVSNTPISYPNTPIRSTDGSTTSSLRERTNELYGSTYPQTFLKDYNATSIWLSFNVRSFWQNAPVPAWLNVALGYSAQNLYGAESNSWTNAAGQRFEASPIEFPRYRQYLLSLDIDLTRIKVKNRFLRTVLSGFNFIKIPAPVLEFNSLGKFEFHPFTF